MDINNIALVRATNVIPFDGIMRPISETPYLKKNANTFFAQEMRQMLIKEGIIPDIDFSRFGDDDYLQEYNKTVSSILNDYIPYSSDYNSMILFSLNGIVPDDIEAGFANNTFSDKKCGIIDDLSEHIDQVVSLVTTDTAIKGTIKLSDNAICLIEKNFFNNLTTKEQQLLLNNHFKVKLFEGSLKDAIKDALLETKRYSAEELTLSRAEKGFKDSSTKAQLLNAINDIAKERNIAQVLHFEVLTGRNDDLDKLTSVQNEYKNILLVNEYYEEQFYRYLFQYLPVPEELQKLIISVKTTSVYVQKLCEIIKEFGLDKYKEIVASYNKDLETKQKEGSLPTPEQIVSMNKSKHL